MNNRHITKDEWIQFYTASQPSQENRSLQGRVLAHVAFCKECAMIYKNTRAMKNEAANAAAALRRTHGAHADSAYLAVASDSAHEKTKKQSGLISVEIDGQEGVFRFVEDSVITKGCANKYAMNPEDEGRTLRDDFDAVVLSIQDDTLTLHVNDGSMRAQGVLRTLEKTQMLEASGNTYTVTLPQNALCLLEITLSE